MKELGLVLVGCAVFAVFFAGVIYPELEYKGYSRNHTCTGQCYADYVAEYGTAVEILQAKQELAAGDPFSNIRSLWAGCAACHGAQGQGGVGPMLAGQSSIDIVGKLTTYKTRGQVGPMSEMMWGQAENLSDDDIQTIGDFVEANFPSE